jgi:multiple sugar transport system ATP-binding protein
VLQQVGPPDQVYRQPANVFVAGFMGSPPMTLVETSLTAAEGDGLVVRLGERDVQVDELEQAMQPSLRAHAGARVIVGIRSEDLSLGGDAPAERRIRATLMFEEQLGSSLVGYFAVPGMTGALPAGAEFPAEPASPQGRARPQHLPARFSADTQLAPGAGVDLALQRGALRFFDAATGLHL